MASVTKKTVNKFTSNLQASHKTIKAKRAMMLSADVQAEQEDLIRVLESKLRNVESTIMNLEDMYPDSTTTLLVGGKDFDGKKWVSEMQQAKKDRAIIEIDLSFAKSTMKEYFTI